MERKGQQQKWNIGEHTKERHTNITSLEKNQSQMYLPKGCLQLGGLPLVFGLFLLVYSTWRRLHYNTPQSKAVQTKQTILNYTTAHYTTQSTTWYDTAHCTTQKDCNTRKSKKVQQQRQTLEIVEDFACEDKTLENLQRFRNWARCRRQFKTHTCFFWAEWLSRQINNGWTLKALGYTCRFVRALWTWNFTQVRDRITTFSLHFLIFSLLAKNIGNIGRFRIFMFFVSIFLCFFPFCFLFSLFFLHLSFFHFLFLSFVLPNIVSTYVFLHYIWHMFFDFPCLPKINSILCVFYFVVIQYDVCTLIWFNLI